MLALLAIAALTFGGMNGFLVIWTIPFSFYHGIIPAVKVVVWSATGYALGHLHQWWPFLVGFAVASALTAIDNNAWMQEQQATHKHPIYMNRNVGLDFKLNLMFSRDLGRGLLLVLMFVFVAGMLIAGASGLDSLR